MIRRWLLAATALCVALPAAAQLGPQPQYSPGAPSPLSNAAMFGTGSDGNVTISGTVTLTRDMNYNNLTIVAGGSLRPAGFRIYVANTLDITAAPGGGIQTTQAGGSNAIAAAGGLYTVPGIAPLAGVTGSGIGGAGQTGAGSVGVANTAAAVNVGNGGRTGAGGTGGAGGSAGGAGAVQGKPSFNPSGNMIAFPTPNVGPFFDNVSNAGQSFVQNVWPSYSAGGGGGGGGDGVNAGGGGGASATPPYGVAIYAATIARGANVATFVINGSASKGGNGAVSAGGNAAGGGGGGGVGGTAVYIVAGQMTGNTITNGVDVSGGNGGDGGNGTGTGVGGNGGDGGGCGSVQIVVLAPPSYTQSTGFNTAGAAGNAGSGTTGGTGGAGCPKQVNL